MAKQKFVKVKALKVKDGKPQHMTVDKIYTVTEENSKILIKNKRATLVK